jgi:hypothetical protein
MSELERLNKANQFLNYFIRILAVLLVIIVLSCLGFLSLDRFSGRTERVKAIVQTSEGYVKDATLLTPTSLKHILHFTLEDGRKHGIVVSLNNPLTQYAVGDTAKLTVKYSKWSNRIVSISINDSPTTQNLNSDE